MRKAIWQISIILFFSSCIEKEFIIESKYENGQEEIIFKPMGDTTIFGTNFQRKYKISFFENGDTLRTGVFLNNKAFGRHFFFERNRINCILEYVLPDTFYLNLDNVSNSIDWTFWIPKRDSTHLNTISFLDLTGDTITEKSIFYRMDVENVGEDSIKCAFEFVFYEREFHALEVYAKTKELDNVQLIRTPGNRVEFIREKTGDSTTFNFLVVMMVFNPEAKKMVSQEVFDNAIMLINETVPNS